ncbi:MAG: hypothetical protein ACJ72K_10845 [Friedmanniella sp.]
MSATFAVLLLAGVTALGLLLLGMLVLVLQPAPVPVRVRDERR